MKDSIESKLRFFHVAKEGFDELGSFMALLQFFGSWTVLIKLGKK